MPKVDDGSRMAPPSVRFWRKVDKTNGPEHPEHGRCWMWFGCRSKNGYGQINIGGVITYAHRFSYQMSLELPEGRDVLHKCDNPSCVNPGHLFSGTAKVNGEDMASKGRQDRGEDRWSHKLTEKTVAEMRGLYQAGI